MKYQLLKSLIAFYGIETGLASDLSSESGIQCVGSHCDHYHKKKSTMKTRVIKPSEVGAAESVTSDCSTDSTMSGCPQGKSSVVTKTIVKVVPKVTGPTGFVETERTDIDTTVYKRPSKLRRILKRDKSALVHRSISTSSQNTCCNTVGGSTVCSVCGKQMSNVKKPEVVISRSQETMEAVPEKRASSVLSRLPLLRRSNSASSKCCQVVDDKTVCSSSCDSLSRSVVSEGGTPNQMVVRNLEVEVPFDVELTRKQKREMRRISKKVAAGKAIPSKYTVRESIEPINQVNDELVDEVPENPIKEDTVTKVESENIPNDSKTIAA
jgi:hypothetical protein